MKHSNDTERLLARGMALHAGRSSMEQRVRAVFARRRSAWFARVAAAAFALGLGLACFTTACRPVKVAAQADAQADASAPDAAAPTADALEAAGPVQINPDPDAGALPMPAAQPTPLTQAALERIADAFFRGRNAVYMEYAPPTRAQIEDAIAELRSLMQEHEAYLAEGGDPEAWVEDRGSAEDYPLLLAELEAALETAPAEERNLLLERPMLRSIAERGETFLSVDTKAYAAGVKYSLSYFCEANAPGESEFWINPQNEMTREDFLASAPGDGAAMMSLLGEHPLAERLSYAAEAEAAVDPAWARRQAADFLEAAGFSGAQALDTVPVRRFPANEAGVEYGWLVTLGRWRGELFRVGVCAGGVEAFHWRVTGRYSSLGQPQPFLLTAEANLPVADPAAAAFSQAEVDAVTAAFFGGAPLALTQVKDGAPVAGFTLSEDEYAYNLGLNVLAGERAYRFYATSWKTADAALAGDQSAQLSITPVSSAPEDGRRGDEDTLAAADYGLRFDLGGDLMERTLAAFPAAQAAGVANAFWDALAAQGLDLSAYRLTAAEPSYRLPNGDGATPERCWLFTYAAMRGEALRVGVSPDGPVSFAWRIAAQ